MHEKSFYFLSPGSKALAAAVAFAFALMGCQPSIGDKCVLNTDCSSSGTRQCDNSMPGGYCTIFNCGPNTCPDHSACYLFNAAVQGCPYSDRELSRTSHSFCLEDCSQNSDCRADYICADLRRPPWNAILLDDNQAQAVCIPGPDAEYGDGGTTPEGNDAAPVCQADPDIDAAFPVPPDEDAGPEPVDAGPDAAVDAGADTGTGALDAGGDGGADAGLDAGADATLPGDAGGDASDAGAADATSD